MRQEVPAPLVIGVVVVVLLVVGAVFWKGLFGRRQVIADPNQMPPTMRQLFTHPAGRASR